MSFICAHCESSFTRKNDLLRHILKFHTPKVGVQKNNIVGVQKNNIKCCYCECDFKKSKSYETHLALRHNIEIKTEKLSFSNADEFSQWKENEERLSKSNFTCTHCFTKRCGDKVKNYFCNRRGIFKNQNHGLRRVRTKGTCKAGLTCSARIIASTSVKDGSLSVTYHSTHTGHSHKFCYLRLPPSQERSIAARIAAGVTPNRILEEIRDEGFVTNVREKKHFINKKKLHNIMQKYNLCERGKYHQIDEVSVDLFVEECANLVNNPILLYKKQGDSEAVIYMENNSVVNNISSDNGISNSSGTIATGLDVEKSPNLDVIDVDEIDESVFITEHFTIIDMTLDKNEFMLVIMTKAQGEMMKKFGSSTILVDSTHGTNSYDFQLTTLVTLDEYAEGFPVAFCLSSKVNTTSMKLFFEVIKSRIGTIETETFISDDAHYYYNAWEETMSTVKHRILCKWYIDRAWREKLDLIPDKNARHDVYSTLRILMEEVDVQEFQTLLLLFLQKLKEEKYNEFYNYFLSTYANRPTVWASCYRTKAFLNTNKAFEAFHRVLERVYFPSQKNRRLDILINKLFAVVRDKLYKRLITMEEGHVDHRVSGIDRRHRSSADVTDITEISMNEWRIIAVGKKNAFYSVLKEANSCECKLKCLLCKACIHMYSCNCHDYLVKHNLCKHIHAAIKFQQQDEEHKTLQTLDNGDTNLVKEEDYDLVYEVFEQNVLQYPIVNQKSILVDKMNRLSSCIQLAVELNDEDFNNFCLKEGIMNKMDDMINLFNKTFQLL